MSFFAGLCHQIKPTYTLNMRGTQLAAYQPMIARIANSCRLFDQIRVCGLVAEVKFDTLGLWKMG